jgi:hypothetical protein
MERDWTYAKNNEIEIRIDLARPETNVEYRFLSEQSWTSSPFQSLNFRCGTADEIEALKAVYNWLE